MVTKLPVALGDRLEFASRSWLAEAARYLRQRITREAGCLDGVRWSECEIYTEAPSHLGWPRNRAAFFLRVDGNEIEVGEGEMQDADRKVHADYDQALAIVTTVGGDDRTQLSRAHREHAHRHGPKAWRVEEGQPPSPVLRRVLDDLHDHMARRTVTNPDLDHRIGHLGLAAQRDELDATGYTILERAITPDFADEIKDALDRAIDETQGPGAHGLGTGRDGSVGRLLERGRIFEEAAQHPLVLALQEHVVGRGCLLSISTGIRKGPGDDTHVVHVDYPLIQEPFPAYTLMATTIWALDDFDEACGPTLVVPGSYKRNRNPQAGEGEDELVPIVMPKGSIAMWRGNTWHSSRVRTAPGYRVTLHETYCRLHVRPIDGYLGIDPAILERNGPQLATLCGFDDLFEKSTETGPYLEGVAYAREHYVVQPGGRNSRAAKRTDDRQEASR